MRCFRVRTEVEILFEVSLLSIEKLLVKFGMARKDFQNNLFFRISFQNIIHSFLGDCGIYSVFFFTWLFKMEPDVLSV